MTSYKICSVPACTNTTIKFPNKLFIHVPKCPKRRKKWLELAHRDPKLTSVKSVIFFCEDHFDLPNDMDNYMQYCLMGSVGKIRMKPNCVPTKFQCKQDKLKCTVLSHKEQEPLLKGTEMPVTLGMSSESHSSMEKDDVSNFQGKAIHVDDTPRKETVTFYEEYIKSNKINEPFIKDEPIEHDDCIVDEANLNEVPTADYESPALPVTPNSSVESRKSPLLLNSSEGALLLEQSNYSFSILPVPPMTVEVKIERLESLEDEEIGQAADEVVLRDMCVSDYTRRRVSDECIHTATANTYQCDENLPTKTTLGSNDGFLRFKSLNEEFVIKDETIEHNE